MITPRKCTACKEPHDGDGLQCATCRTKPRGGTMATAAASSPAPPEPRRLEGGDARRPPDYQRMADLLQTLAPGTRFIDFGVFEGEPYSKARPRFANGRAHSSKKQRRAERQLAEHLALKHPTPIEGNLAVICIFYRSTRQRIDVDNMLKHVMDAATGVCWEDDSQVTAMVGLVELDRESPRTLIAIAQHESTMDRSPLEQRECERCGDLFTIPHARSKQRFCGRKCFDRHARDRGTVRCQHCDTEFLGAATDRKYCSRDCYTAVRRKTAADPDCVDCGSTLPKSSATRCRECWLKHVSSS